MEIKQAVPTPYEKAISPAISFDVDIAHTKFQEAIIGVEGFLESDDGKILARVAEVSAEQAKISGIGAKGTYSTRRLQKQLKNNGYKPETINKIIEYYTKGSQHETQNEVPKMRSMEQNRSEQTIHRTRNLRTKNQSLHPSVRSPKN